MVLFLDELKLSIELTEAANKAVAAPSRDVSKEAMYFGILTNKILPGVTVLGFSRSGNYTSKRFLDRQSEAYTLVDVDIKDFQETIEKHAEDSEKMKKMFNQLKQIGMNQIFFVMKIFEHKEIDLKTITTASDLFLIMLHRNLAFHEKQNDTGFAEMLEGENVQFVEDTFKLCKENLQNPGKDEDRAGVFIGTITKKEIWKSDVSEIEVPIRFLKSVGIFEIPPKSYEALTLTAQHLSFVEFFASVGIILSYDIKAELSKIKNNARARAVCYYIWNDLLKFNLIYLI